MIGKQNKKKRLVHHNIYSVHYQHTTLLMILILKRVFIFSGSPLLIFLISIFKYSIEYYSYNKKLVRSKYEDEIFLFEISTFLQYLRLIHFFVSIQPVTLLLHWVAFYSIKLHPHSHSCIRIHFFCQKGISVIS